MDNEPRVYPVTIITTRYGGVYEGGPWAALDCSHEEMPAAAVGDDVECAEFWALAREGGYEISDWRAWVEAPPPLPSDPSMRPRRMLNVGVGDTPDRALTSLLERRARMV